MTTKRILSLILACLMLLPLLIACSDKPDSGRTDPAGSGTASASPVTEPVTEYVFHDAVPELDFDGEEFDILQTSEKNWLYVEDLNGEKLNDAVYERNREMEERFNITIEEPVTVEWNDFISMATQLVTADDDQYDMASFLLRRVGELMKHDLLRNVLTLPYIDIDNPWYTQGLEDAVLDGKLIFLTCDYTLSYTAATVAMFFNKTKWIDYLHSTEDLYQTVRDGKWTFDRLMEYSCDMYADLNGNGQRDGDDFYGFGSDPYACTNGFFYGANMRRMEIIGNSYSTYEIKMDILNEPVIDLYSKLRLIMITSNGANWGTGVFYSGNALFTSFSVGRITSPEMVDMEDDFGILPVPKWNEDQQEYYTNIDNQSSDVICVLKTVRNTELVGAMIEAMSAASYEQVVPLYCESVLELRGARDPESSEMLRMILDTRVMDWETLYGSGGWTTRHAKFVTRENCPEIVSGIQERLREVQNIYDNQLDIILNLQ